MAAGARRRARWYALQVMYALDLNDSFGPAEAVHSYHHEFELDLEPRSVEFAAELVEGAWRELAELDDVVQSASRNWRLERMSRVDRNILRLATYELKGSPEVPLKVVINEAIEVAKRFGAAESAAFVNGILDRIAGGLERSPETD